MLDPNNLLAKVLGGGAAQGFGGGLLGGALSGLLVGSKGGRKLAKNAVKVGGIAAIGALAYHAYTRYQASQGGAAAAPVGDLTPPPSDREAQLALGVTLIRAMIAAAKADGQLDAAETGLILTRLGSAQIDDEERAFLLQEIGRSIDLETLVREARTPQIAAEIYTAALLGAATPSAAESAWLKLLAARLELDETLVGELQRTVEAARTEDG